MSLIASAFSTLVAIAAGWYSAICVSVIDLGYHKDSFGKKKQKVVLFWEIILKDGSHHLVFRTFTLFLHPSGHLLPFLQKWMGMSVSQTFDLSTLVGKTCYLSVDDKANASGQVFPEVVSIKPDSSGQKLIPQNPLIVFDNDMAEPQRSQIKAQLQDWVQRRIDQSVPRPTSATAAPLAMPSMPVTTTTNPTVNPFATSIMDFDLSSLDINNL